MLDEVLMKLTPFLFLSGVFLPILSSTARSKFNYLGTWLIWLLDEFVPELGWHLWPFHWTNWIFQDLIYPVEHAWICEWYSLSLEDTVSLCLGFVSSSHSLRTSEGGNYLRWWLFLMANRAYTAWFFLWDGSLTCHYPFQGNIFRRVQIFCACYVLACTSEFLVPED